MLPRSAMTWFATRVVRNLAETNKRGGNHGRTNHQPPELLAGITAGALAAAGRWPDARCAQVEGGKSVDADAQGSWKATSRICPGDAEMLEATVVVGRR